ncbi:MAG: enoyl-CoA hydratase/isomerase family protein [Bacteriovoracales bacterium]|nr:enoyl-CoA hydratase/isomerase family protein [Bacteriovoracales bacterium]
MTYRLSGKDAPFDFGSIEVLLHKKTKHLEIILPEHFCPQMLFELETLLSWSADKAEIHALLLRPKGESFPSSLPLGEFQTIPLEKLQTLLERIRKLVVGMFYLPQTVFMDLGLGCSDLGAELCLGADLRIASTGAHLHWSHLGLGRSPCSGGSGILPLLVGDATARKWVLGGESLETHDLVSAGFLLSTYGDEREAAPLMQGHVLRHVCAQASVARIQTKRAFLEHIMTFLDKAQEIENKISAPALMAEDYKDQGQGFGPGSDKTFCSPKDFGAKLKKALSRKDSEGQKKQMGRISYS